MTYTVNDTPRTRLRIEKDLAKVAAAVQAADPGLRSLILTGGFARGEGAMLDGQPQNDYDFVAVRGLRGPRRAYARVRERLEGELGLHIDLAPVAAWRLPRVAPSIFWYETALRGRVVWGEDVLSRIPIRSAAQLDRAEGLRLLVNRGAGLLLVTDKPSPHDHRIQAAKGLLAAMDAFLLSRGIFPPTQTERWADFQNQYQRGQVPAYLADIVAWVTWAYQFKVDPEHAPERDHQLAWKIAARAILDAVPTALQHARMPSLEAYARRDGLLDHLFYWARAGGVPGAKKLLTNPTGRVRVATLRLLEASLDGKVRPEAVKASLGPIARSTAEPLRLLDGLRKATLQ